MTHTFRNHCSRVDPRGMEYFTSTLDDELFHEQSLLGTTESFRLQTRQSPKQPADGWSPGIRFADPNVKPYVPPLPFPERQI